MLLDRQRVKFWQKWVFGFMALIMAGFLVMIPLSSKACGCGGTTSATEQLDKEITKYQAAVTTDPKDVDAWRSLAENYVLRANQQAAGLRRPDGRLAHRRRSTTSAPSSCSASRRAPPPSSSASTRSSSW